MDAAPTKTNEPGHWHRELAQHCRDTAARLLQIADELDVDVAKIETARQERLADASDERVPDGTYGGAR